MFTPSRSTSARQVVLVGLDGVVRHRALPDALIEVAHDLPLGALRQATRAPDALIPALTGAITDEAWRQRVAAVLRVTYDAVTADHALAQWSGPAMATVDPAVLAVLDACRPRSRVVLAANATTCLARDLAALGLDRHFDGVASSSALRVALPDPRFFAAVLAATHATPGDALFVDGVPEHVAAAERAGLRAHRYVGPAALRAFLAAHGLLPARIARSALPPAGPDPASGAARPPAAAAHG